VSIFFFFSECKTKLAAVLFYNEGGGQSGTFQTGASGDMQFAFNVDGLI